MLKKSFCIGQPFKTAVRDSCRSKTLTGVRGACTGIFGAIQKRFRVCAIFAFDLFTKKKLYFFDFSQNSNDFLREMGYTINCRARGAATASLHMIPPHTKAIPQTEIPSGVPQALEGVFVFIRFCIL